ncbi:MAG: hypothetical protein JW936_01255 [Sedimentisphaerales bacterium]|nr:hypothetical protein [Sedimentisphaerales bacterium]
MLTRTRVLQFATESVKGTPETLNTFILTYDAKLVPSDSFSESKPNAAYSGHTDKSRRDGSNTGKLTFKTPLRGDGAGGWDPAILSLILGCGHSNNAGVLTPVTDPATQKCLTMGLFEGGRKKGLSGGMGKFVLKPGDGLVWVEFEFEGVWASVTTTAMASPTYSTVAPIKWGHASNVLSLNSVTSYPSDFSFESGGEISPVVNCGVTRYMIISDRSPKFETDPAAVTPAVNDLHGKRDDEAPIAASLALTNGTDTITLAGSNWQITDIDDTDQNGTLADKVGGPFVTANSHTGDNEYSLTAA